MAVRPFVPWPDKRLQTVAVPVDVITDDIQTIWADMIETMEAMPGYGLAAPQIGVMQRLAVIDASQERGKAVRMANPELIDVSPDLFEHAEGSPNLPGVSAKLKRPQKVIVAFTDHTGMRVRQTFEDLWATSVQHQIDHLNGRMYFDNLSRTKRAMLLKKAAKVAR